MSNSLKGLTQDEVIRSREQYGANLLTPPKRKSLWRLFIEKFNDPVIRILLVAAVLSLGIGFIHNEFAEAIGIFCAIFLATGVAFWFEYDAMKKFDVLNSTNDDTPVKAVRDGAVAEIPKKEVVVGDIVLLESGEEVPADGILQEAVSLKINESTLTGEPQIGKTTDPAHFDKESTYPSDHVMRGTTVVEGHGVMQVTAVGDATEFGKVAEQATVESNEETPLNLQLQRLSKLIGRVGISLAIVTFAALIVKGMLTGDLLTADWLTVATEVLQYFMVAVTLIVVAVMWGRSLYRNIQRFVLFQLTINFVAIIIVLFGSIFGSELPLTVTQMLWVNLIMDTFAALALASLPPSRSVMREKPRKNSDFIISRPMMRSIVGVGLLFVAVLLGILYYFGSAITIYELSAFFTVFVMLQFWNMFNAKGFGTTTPIWKAVGGCAPFFGVLLLILAGQFIIVTWGGNVFRTVPLSGCDWLTIIGATSLVMWGGELTRALSSRRRHTTK